MVRLIPPILTFLLITPVCGQDQVSGTTVAVVVVVLVLLVGGVAGAVGFVCWRMRREEVGMMVDTRISAEMEPQTYLTPGASPSATQKLPKREYLPSLGSNPPSLGGYPPLPNLARSFSSKPAYNSNSPVNSTPSNTVSNPRTTAAKLPPIKTPQVNALPVKNSYAMLPNKREGVEEKKRDTVVIVNQEEDDDGGFYETPSNNEDERCFRCDDKYALVGCTQCAASFCEDCSGDLHNFGEWKNHELYDLFEN